MYIAIIGINIGVHAFITDSTEKEVTGFISLVQIQGWVEEKKPPKQRKNNYYPPPPQKKKKKKKKKKETQGIYDARPVCTMQLLQ